MGKPEQFETHRQRSVFKISKVFFHSEHPFVPADEATVEAGDQGHEVKSSEEEETSRSLKGRWTPTISTSSIATFARLRSKYWI